MVVGKEGQQQLGTARNRATKQRTNAGLTEARGRQGGRPSGLNKEAESKAEAAKTLYLQKDKPVEDIAKLLGVSWATIYCYLGLLGVATGPAAAVPTPAK